MWTFRLLSGVITQMGWQARAGSATHLCLQKNFRSFNTKGIILRLGNRLAQGFERHPRSVGETLLGKCPIHFQKHPPGTSRSPLTGIESGHPRQAPQQASTKAKLSCYDWRQGQNSPDRTLTGSVINLSTDDYITSQILHLEFVRHGDTYLWWGGLTRTYPFWLAIHLEWYITAKTIRIPKVSHNRNRWRFGVTNPISQNRCVGSHRKRQPAINTTKYNDHVHNELSTTAVGACQNQPQITGNVTSKYTRNS